MGLATKQYAVTDIIRAIACRGKSVAIAATLYLAATGMPSQAAPDNTIDFPPVKVISPDNTPVNNAQVVVRKYSRGYFPKLKWASAGEDRIIKPELKTNGIESTEGTYEIIARAPGFATTYTNIDLPTSQSLVTVKLSPGKQVKLKLKDEAGRPIPANLIPAVFPESLGVSVWISSQEDNNENTYAPETLLSPVAVKRAEGGEAATGNFTLNIDPKSTEPLYVLLNTPGYMRAFQAGPFAPADWATSETVELKLPKPASFSARFDLNGNETTESVVTLEIQSARKVPGKGWFGLRLTTEEMPITSPTISANDFAPGIYCVAATLGPKEKQFREETFSTDKISLKAGTSKSVVLKYIPFKSEWLKGSYTAKLKVLDQKGEPTVGAPYKLTWYEPGYPEQTVAEGRVPESGIVEIKGLAGIDKPMTREETEKLEGGVPSFRFEAAGQRLGYISFWKYQNGYHPLPEKIKEITFRFPPTAGDPAPDFAMHDIATSKTIHLSDFKGKVVLIDFWATWCGPCQGPMAENQKIMRKHQDDWKDKAVILTVSIDDDLETVIKHLDKNDWHETHNAWAAPDLAKPDDVGWQAPAAKLYGINSIPTMVLIGTDGVIRKRGHMDDVEAAMEKELKADDDKIDVSKTEPDDAATSAPARKGGGDLTKVPVEKIMPPSTETNYSTAGHAATASSLAPIKAPSTETSYTGRAASAVPVRVALFADPASTDKKSREAIWSVLSHTKGIAAQKVTTPTVSAPGFFDKFDVFVLPGGTASGEAKAIGADTGKTIAQHLKAGKGLVAICAGGYYVAEGWNPATAALDVINAENHDGEHWARGEQFIQVKVVGEDDVTSAIPHTMWYENGPIFKPAGIDNLPGYVPLVKYITDLAAKDAPKGQMAGRDAVIAAPYGKGRIVAFGPHPELSPGLSHWLINAVKWAAGRHGDNSNINAKTVLEGRGD